MDCTELNIQFPLTGAGNRSTDRLHLSDIYTDLERVLFTKTSNADMTNPLWAEVGFLWEDLLTRVLADHCGARPGEVELDGIVGSPDGYDPDSGILYEYKSTWKSVKNAHPKDVWKWMTQVKGYCMMLGVSTVIFHVFYIMGDYRGSGPLYRSYLFTFTERELQENWQMLKNHAKSRGWL